MKDWLGKFSWSVDQISRNKQCTDQSKSLLQTKTATEFWSHSINRVFAFSFRHKNHPWPKQANVYKNLLLKNTVNTAKSSSCLCFYFEKGCYIPSLHKNAFGFQTKAPCSGIETYRAAPFRTLGKSKTKTLGFNKHLVSTLASDRHGDTPWKQN